MTLAGLGLSGCAQRPQEVATSHGKEYFPSSIYGRASPRVVADGQPVPRGGGQYLVGKPYTVAGRTYYPSESKATQVGHASWYGDAFHGRLTANGEIYDRDAFTAASPTMPLPSYARVTNLRNNYSMIVRVNDRGPYASDRIMDVSRRVAEALDYKRHGTTTVKVEYVGRASLAGSDDARLYATLRTDGPPSLKVRPTMIAASAPRVRVASNAPFVSDDRTREFEGQRGFVPPAVPHRSHRFAADDSRQPEPRTERAGDDFSARRVSASSGRGFEDRDERVGPRTSEGRIRTAYRARGRTETGPLPPARNLSRAQRGQGDHWVSTHAAQAYPPHKPEAVMPPARPMDLETIPGAGSQIRVHREPQRLHVARSRYE